MHLPEIKVLPDLSSLAQEGAQRIADAAGRAIANHGAFTLALSGGSTPKPVYELLAQEPFRSQIDWEKVEIYFGDERCVPADSPQSNYRMANEALLSKVPIPSDNVFRMRGEIDPHTAAIEYGQMLKSRLGDGGLDLVLLGMGPDGHTASLFPGTEALDETHHRCVANFVPKMNAWRITLTAPFLNRSFDVMFLVAGADKEPMVSRALEGSGDPIPVQLIQPQGRLVWLLDAAAAGMHGT
jgi:6-phosphogluconolactonase